MTSVISLSVFILTVIVGCIGGSIGELNIKLCDCEDLNRLCNRDEVLVKCSHTLPLSCSNQQIRHTDRCVNGCFCKPGLVRNTKTWKCVKPSQCPTDSDSQCRDDEEFIECSHEIPTSCTNTTVIIVEDRCVVGCYCKSGLLRNRYTWECLRPTDCPSGSN